MISIQNVSKSYDNGKTFSVSDLSLEIRDGEIFGLLGPNGAGKSTLLNMITGVLAPTKGQILVDGTDVALDPVGVKRNMCYVTDSPDHLLRLRGREFLSFIADVYDVPAAVRAERITRLSEEYGMADQLNAQIQSYSHGMRQKIMIIGALLAEPRTWILDEPMTGLDPKAAWLLKQSMRAHADAGNTVLFSTHVLDVAERLVDRVGVVAHGRVLFVGTVEELRSHFAKGGSLEEMFLELTAADSPFGAMSEPAPSAVPGAPMPPVGASSATSEEADR